MPAGFTVTINSPGVVPLLLRTVSQGSSTEADHAVCTRLSIATRFGAGAGPPAGTSNVTSGGFNFKGLLGVGSALTFALTPTCTLDRPSADEMRICAE